MAAIFGDDRHFSQCLRFHDIDWNAAIKASGSNEKVAHGKVMLTMDNQKKFYEVAANGLFGKSGEKCLLKANETLSFEVHEAETLAIVGESGRGNPPLPKC